MTDIDKLKPCPFCGGEAGLGKGKDGPFVNCTECLVSTNVLVPLAQTIDEAIGEWNRRDGKI